MTFVTKPVKLQVGGAHIEFYSMPWHGETTGTRASMAAEMKLLHELGDGQANYGGQTWGKVRG